MQMNSSKSWMHSLVRRASLKVEPWQQYQNLSESSCELIWVLKGDLNILIQTMSLKGRLNPKEALLQLNEGDLFFVPKERTKMICSLFSKNEAVVCSLSIKRFCELLGGEPTAKNWVNSIERWVLRLLPILVDINKEAYKTCRKAKKNSEELIHQGESISLDNGLLWLSMDLFELEYLKEFADTPSEIFLPLVPLLQFKAKEDVVVKAELPRVLFSGESGEVLIKGLRDYLNIQLLNQAHVKDHSFFAEEKQKRELRKLQVQTVQQKMIGLLQEKPSPVLKTKEVLIEACFSLIHRQGWVPVVPNEIDTSNTKQFILKMADASGLSVRFARLKGKWYQEDCGTFLAFNSSKEPTILSLGSKGYEATAFGSSEKRIISCSEEAEAYTGEVVYFYKNFDNQKLKMRQLLSFEVEKVKKEVMTLVFIALALAGLTTLLPLITAFLINDVIPSGQKELLYVFTFAAVGVGVAKLCFEWVHEVTMTRMNMKSEFATTAALWDRVLHFPLRVLQQFGAGEWASRMNSILGMKNFYRSFAQTTVLQGVQILFSLGLMMWVHFELAIFGLLSVFFFFLITLGFSWWQMKSYQGGEKSIGVTNSFVLDVFSGIHKIRAAAAEISVYAQWADRYARTKAKSIASQKVEHAYSGFQSFWGAFSLAIIYFIVVELREDNIELGSFIAFLSAYATLTSSVNLFSKMVMSLSMQLPISSYVSPLMNNVPLPRNGKLHPKRIQGNLKLEGLFYSYPQQVGSALQNFSLEIPFGKFYAVVGPSGCGKSTLTRLLSGLEKPQRGCVFLDDYDFETIDRRDLHSHIAVVQQNPSLFPGSLFENIKGASQASIEEVNEAVRLACFDTELKSLAMGLHTVIGGDSQVFSGGQIQRIALARALVKKPKILILDEATSALDNRLQAQVLKNIESLKITVLFVAHRLSTVRHADEIIVLKNGAIAEKGTWKDLLSKEGIFQKLVMASTTEGGR